MNRSDLVTATQIAIRSGVQLSAVTNWRRRSQSFPRPVESGPNGDLFRWNEVERWLDQTGRKAKSESRDWQWRLADALRSDLNEAGALTLLCMWAICTGKQRDQLPDMPYGSVLDLAKSQEALHGLPTGLLSVELPDESKHESNQRNALLAPLAGLKVPDEQPFLTALEFLRGSSRGKSSLELTSQPGLVDLIAAISPKNARTVFDPAVGVGQLLLAVANNSRSDVALYGQDVSTAATRIAQQLMAAAHMNGDIRTGNSLEDSGFRDQTFDIAVSDPPLNLRLNTDCAAVQNVALQFGGVRPRTADWVWAVECLNHLVPGGTALVTTAPGALFKSDRASEAIRFELLRRGSVASVIMMPPGQVAHSSIPLVLLVLRNAVPGTNQEPVLFIDASDLGGKAKGPNSSLEWVDTVASEYLRWSQGPSNFVETPGLSALVPVLDLLSPEANLLPQRWVTTSDLADPAEAQASARDALNDLEIHTRRATPGAAVPALPDELEATPTFVTLETLSETGAIKVRKGTPISREALTERGELPVLTPGALRDGFIETRTPQFITTPPKRATVTAPGDVIFMPTGSSIRAVVDEAGGHLLAAPLVAITSDPSNTTVEPCLLAALLSSDFVQRQAMGSGIQRVNVLSVVVPVLRPSEAQSFAETLQTIQKIKADAAETLQLAERAEAALTALTTINTNIADSTSSKHGQTRSLPKRSIKRKIEEQRAQREQVDDSE